MYQNFYRNLATTAIELDLQLFAGPTQTTLLNQPGNDLSPEMKIYYHDTLIDNAEPKLVHDQFGSKYPIPKGGGKSIEFRRYSALKKALRTLIEGVTPKGNKLNVSTLTATIEQYGDFIEISDVLDVTAIDRNLIEATKLLGAQMGRTLDTVTREVLNGGTAKLFAPQVVGNVVTPVLLRSAINANCKLTSSLIRKAVAQLKRMNTETINGDFIAIIHTDTACDLRGDPEWLEAHKYAQPGEIYSGEIGKLHGVRFVETTEAKIIAPSDIAGIEGLSRSTLMTAASSTTIALPYNLSPTQVTEINNAISAGALYEVYVNGVDDVVASVTRVSNNECRLTLTKSHTAPAGSVVCGGGAGKDGSAIYSTLLLGSNAYGVTEVTGLGAQHIVKQMGSAGAADPLNQRATTGWKATKTAERLTEEYMLRIEHGSAEFGLAAESN